MDNYLIRLKDKQTGKERDVNYEIADAKDSDDITNDELIDFMWREGNYACDCNRYTSFYPEADDDIECGDNRFQLLEIKNVDTGKIIE